MKKPPYSRCLVILADGARPDVMQDLLGRGKLPYIDRYLVKRGTFKPITTVFPSTTGPAYLPFLTGCFPGTCNVPGIRWFDKQHYAKKGWSFKSFRSYVGLETFLMNSDMSPQIKTAFDLYEKSFSIFNMVTRGIKKENDLTRFSRIWYLYYAHLTDHWAMVDSVSLQKVLKAIDMNAEFIFANFPAIDEYSHRSSPFHPRTLKAYEELDAHVGVIMNKIRDKNWLEDTLVTIVADHGLSETQTHFDVGPYLEDKKGMKTFFYSQIFKFRFKAVSMVSGNGMTHLYFEGERRWKGRVFFEELSKMGLLLDELRLRSEIDILACQGSDESIHILSEKGHAAFKVSGDQIHYEWSQAEPLGLFDSSKNSYDMSFDDSYKLTFNTHHPDIFMQLYQIFKSPRCGDVVLSAKTGFDLRERFEHPEHKSSHGALCDQHMKIPFVMNYPIHSPVIRSVDIFPTILKLTGKEIPVGIDGVSLV